MTYDFITVGGATHDVSFFTDQGVLIDNKGDVLRQKLLAFEYGAKVKVDKFHYSFGGGAANAAVCLASLGLRAAACVAVGSDESGRLIKENFLRRGVVTSLIATAKKEDSGASFIIVTPAGERVIFAQRGANRSLAISREQAAAFKNSSYIYIAALSGRWEDALRRVFAAVGGKRGPKVIWNPGATQYSSGLKKLRPFLKKTAVFALNKDEAIELVLGSATTKAEKEKMTSRFLNETDNLLRAIKDFGPEKVVITMGADGVKVFDGWQIYYQPIMPEKKRVDTTGVGDVFNSSFAAGLALFKGDINRAMRLGLKNTASKVAHLGAQAGLLTKKDLKNLK